MQTESEFQNMYVARLRRMGYQVRVTSSNQRGGKQHRGMCDVLVRNRGWEKAHWIAFESKSESGGLSPEQQEQALVGDIIIVRSWADVCAALELIEETQLQLDTR